MCMESIYEILQSCRTENGVNWRNTFAKEIIGSVVLNLGALLGSVLNSVTKKDLTKKALDHQALYVFL